MISPWKKRVAVGVAIAVLVAFAEAGYAEERSTVRLNFTALEFARQLIREGRVVPDRKGAWAGHKPSRSSENEFLRANGFLEYAKWHLGVDLRHPENTKAHYKFPFGDFQNIHRCGLLAVKSRAHEFGYADIEAAAAKLLAQIDLKNPRR